MSTPGAKMDAAQALNIPLVVVERPAMNYPVVLDNFAAVTAALASLKIKPAATNLK